MIVLDFALVLRRRQPWEALDLGLVLARRWRRTALLAWCSTYGIAALVSISLVFWDTRAAWLGIWWSKPLFDRVLLHVYSRAVFGAEPTLKETLLATLGFLKTGQLWADLSYRRFSAIRSFSLPVTILEGQSGKTRVERIATLARSNHGCATWLTFACANFVVLLMVTLVAAGNVLTPVGVDWGVNFAAFWGVGQVSATQSLIALMVFMLCETLVEPLYVASGFTLYLNRRSELEGWDLELAFRRMEKRLRGITVGSIAAFFAGIMALGFMPADRALAANPVVSGPARVAPGPSPLPPSHPSPPSSPSPPSPPSAPLVPVDLTTVSELSLAKERARTVLKDPVFGHDVVKSVWQLRNPLKPDATAPPSGWLMALLAEFERLVNGFAFLLVWGIRLALGILLVWAIVFAVRWNWRQPRAKRVATPPAMVGGFDVRPESLPRDVGAAARALLEQGAPAQALGLLYRACLAALVHRLRVGLVAGDTEERCVRRVKGRLPATSFAYFERLVGAWQLTAYGHRAPDPAEIADLCLTWSRYFGPDVALGSDAP